MSQTIGRIVVTRVAGNVLTPEIIASLEYGVAVLGVKAPFVVVHSGCGAVKAAMKPQGTRTNQRVVSASSAGNGTVW